MKLKIASILFLTMVLLGCSQQPQQRLTTPTPIQTTPEMENFTITIKLDGSLDDWKNSGVVPLIIEERKPSIPDSANPHLVYLATDGNFIYVAMEIFGKIEEERNYLVLIYNSETKEALRIKWDYVERGFETEYLKDGKYVKNIETYGAKSSNVLEIVSRSYDVAKDCNVIKVIITKRGSVEAEYNRNIPEKASDVIPNLQMNFELKTQLSTPEATQTQIPAQTSVTIKAWKIHKNAWEKVVEKAKNDDYFKYAIYASRTLAVKHPEIYLQADKLFIEKISNNPGFKKAYEIKDVHSKYLFGRNMVGEPFSFDLVDFSKYKTIKSDKIYPESYPILNYIDRRLSPVATTLKTANNEITELEKIEQYYLMENNDGNYIIYCDNDKAYLWSGGKIIDSNLKVVEKIDGHPILIFNEKYVWYPLMDRDDTSKDKNLKEIVEKLSISVRIPSLSDFESEIIEKLKDVTDLKTEQTKMATLASIRAGPLYFEEDWKTIFQSGYGTLWHSIMKEIIKDANYLSPISAYLAAILESNPTKNGLNEMLREYLTYASTNGIQAHGHLWRCSMIEYTIEDSYRAKTGHCVVQAANLMAVLNLAGIDNYRISAVDPHGHDWLYVPDYDVVLSNGKIEREGSVMCEQSKVIRMISHDDKWALVLPYDFYAGTLSPEETIEILNYLKNRHNEEFYGGKKIGKEFKRISLDELIKNIEERKNSWSPQIESLRVEPPSS